jgi:SAM-dependent methyltransferase
MDQDKLLSHVDSVRQSKHDAPPANGRGLALTDLLDPLNVNIAGSAAGAAVYSKALLAIYDLYVLGLSNSYIWRCKTRKLLDLYNKNVSDRHLDIGIGTGYYLDKCKFPSATPNVTLGDLNANCLYKVSQRIKRYRPAQISMDIFDTRTYPSGTFDSLGINYLFHCLMSPVDKKLEIFQHLRPLLREGGVLFGSTILGDTAPHSVVGRYLMKVYNEKGIFSNKEDDVAGLQLALMRSFGNCEIEVHGCVAVFVARAYPGTGAR